MKYRWDKKYLYWGITVFAVVVASLLFYFGLFHMNSLKSVLRRAYNIVSPLIYGAIIAFTLNTAVRFFENNVVFKIMKWRNISITDKKRKATRIICILSTVVLFLLGIYALMAMLLPELFDSIMNLVNDFPKYVSTVEEWFNNFIKNNDDLKVLSADFFTTIEQRMQSWMNTELVPGLNSLLKNFSTGMYGFLVFLKDFLIGIVISIYLLYGKENFVARGKQFMYSRIKIETANNAIRDLQFVNKIFGNYIVGAVIDSTIIGALCYIGMAIIGLPYAILISVIVGVTNVIPFFGPYLGAVPSAFLILIINPWQCLYFLIFILVLQQFDGNVLKPKILGDTTGLSSFLVVASIIIGGGLLGIFGMFVAVPVCAVICTVMRNRMLNRLQKKNLPIKLSYYKNIDHLDIDTRAPIKESVVSSNARNAFQYKGETNLGPDKEEDEVVNEVDEE